MLPLVEGSLIRFLDYYSNILRATKYSSSVSFNAAANLNFLIVSPISKKMVVVIGKVITLTALMITIVEFMIHYIFSYVFILQKLDATVRRNF